MNPLLILVLAAATRSPLPDVKSIDRLTFNIGYTSLPPHGYLTITSAGKISYRNQPEMFTTGSGGVATVENWEIPPSAAKKLFDRMVADGLLELPQRFALTKETRFILSSGRWKIYLTAEPIPKAIMAHLQPLLEKADPLHWKPRPIEKPSKPILTSLAYTFSDGVERNEILFSIARHGTLGYHRQRPESRMHPTRVAVSKVWGLKPDEAAALLDALAADGILNGPSADEKHFPSHNVQAFVGKWQTETRMKSIPAESLKRLVPHLREADPEWWKDR